MPSKIALLHLVSEQTMQNLLPVLALRPGLVVQVRSADERFRRAAENLKKAANAIRGTPPYSDFTPDFEDWVIEDASPSVMRSHQRIADALAQWPGAVVNLTGGTKQMSIGAYLAAAERCAPVLYCDTQQRRFVSLSEQSPLPDLADFNEIASTLTVESVLAAHGVDTDKLRSARPTEDQLQFGREVQGLREINSDALADYTRRIREQLHPKGRTVKKSDIDGVLKSGLPDPNNDTEHQFLQSAERAGWVFEREGHWTYRMTGNTLRTDDRLKVALGICKALVGGWFELHVYDRMRESGQFVDLRTEVQSRDSEQQAIGETDVLGIDRKRLGLVFVSCKVSDKFLDKPLEHVFATRHRALEFGGTFAQTIFCIRNFHDANKRKIVSDACKVVRARLVEGEPQFDLMLP